MIILDKLLFIAVIANCKRVTKAEISVSNRLGTHGRTVSYYFYQQLKKQRKSRNFWSELPRNYYVFLRLMREELSTFTHVVSLSCFCKSLLM